MSELDQYASYFSAGMKIGVRIPMAADAGLFNDWARIHEVDEDLVFMQLSRDYFPEGVLMHVGQIIELKGGNDETGYSCRGIVVSEGEASSLLVRLTGEVVTDELREFYRIDVFLPIKYYVSTEQNPKELEKEWKARREQRLDEEMLRKQKRWESRLATANAELPHERHQESTGQGEDSAWDTIIPLAANISGGGLRIVAHQEFEIGQYLLLEILVPSSPRRIVDAIGRVVFINRNYAASTDRDSYNVALKFVFVDERDRDALLNHVASIQMQRLRQLREHYAARGTELSIAEEEMEPPTRGQLFARRTLCILLFAGIVTLIIYYFSGYVTNRPKGEIERIFEDGIRAIIELRKQ